MSLLAAAAKAPHIDWAGISSLLALFAGAVVVLLVGLLRSRAVFGLISLAALTALLYFHLRAPRLVPPKTYYPPERPISPAVYGGTQLYMPDDGVVTNSTACTSDGTESGSVATCTPSFCKNLADVISAPTKPTCAFQSSSQTAYADAVRQAQPACESTCSQNTAHPFCAKAFLAATFGGRANGVLAAYCNNNYLVIHSTGNASYQHNLDNVPHPPTGPSNCFTREASIGGGGYHKFKIPLSPVSLGVAAVSNNVNTNAFPGGAAINGSCTLDAKLGSCYMPADKLGVSRGFNPNGPDGVNIDGAEIFPMFNNMNVIDAAQCNQDGCGAHVGQGGGQPHVHGDPFGPLCLYSSKNYTSTSAHPPLIGFAFDGFSIYGRHLYATTLGASVSLDACGGHTHGTL